MLQDDQGARIYLLHEGHEPVPGFYSLIRLLLHDKLGDIWAIFGERDVQLHVLQQHDYWEESEELYLLQD